VADPDGARSSRDPHHADSRLQFGNRAVHLHTVLAVARLQAVLGSVWARWTRVARAIGDLQARLLLLVVYFIVMPAFAVCARLLQGPFGAVNAGAAGFWSDRPPTQHTLTAARRQY